METQVGFRKRQSDSREVMLQMPKPLLTVLLLLPLFAQGGEKRVLGSASYKDVCTKMAAAGITSRTQTTPATDSITNNALVVVGSDDLNRSRENRLVSNTNIFVRANVMGVSTYTSNGIRPSASQADPCASVRNAKISEESQSKPGDEPIPPPNVFGR